MPGSAVRWAHSEHNREQTDERRILSTLRILECRRILWHGPAMVVHRVHQQHSTVNGAALRCHAHYSDSVAHCGIPVVSAAALSNHAAYGLSIVYCCGNRPMAVATVRRRSVRNPAQRRSGGLTTRRCCHRCETCGSTSCRPEPSTATSTYLPYRTVQQCEYTQAAVPIALGSVGCYEYYQKTLALESVPPQQPHAVVATQG